MKNQIPGITEEQLNWIMQANGEDINREKAAADQYKTQLASANAQLKTAQEGLAKFDGVDVEGLNAQITKLQADMKAQADESAFNNALDIAILGAKGRNVQAVRALLDLDALKGSKDRTADISKALEDAAKANPWAFGEAASGVATVDTGAEHGTPPAGADYDGVTASFKALNPNIKFD